MKLNIIAFDGDGIGPEIVSSTLDVINLLNSKLKLDIEIQREILGFNLIKNNYNIHQINQRFKYLFCSLLI